MPHHHNFTHMWRLSIALHAFRHPLVPLRCHLKPFRRPLTPLHHHLRLSVSLDAFFSPLNTYHTSPFNSSPSTHMWRLSIALYAFRHPLEPLRRHLKPFRRPLNASPSSFTPLRFL